MSESRAMGAVQCSAVQAGHLQCRDTEICIISLKMVVDTVMINEDSKGSANIMEANVGQACFLEECCVQHHCSLTHRSSLADEERKGLLQ